MLFNTLWRALFVFNLFLWVALFLQITIFALFYFNINFSVPKNIETLIQNEFQKNGVLFQCSNIKISLNAVIAVNDLSLRFAGTANDFLVAKKVQVRLSKTSLFRGEFLIKSVFAENMNLSYSTQKSDEYLVKNINFYARKKGLWWNIRRFNASLSNLRLRGSGSVNENFFANNFSTKDTKDSKENKAIWIQWDEICSFIIDAQKHFSKCTRPVLILDFDLSSVALDKCFATFYTSGATFDTPVGELNLQNLIFSTNITKEELETKAIDLNLRVNSLSIADFKIEKNLNFSAELNYETIELNDIRLYALDLSYENLKFDYFDLWLNHIALLDLPLDKKTLLEPKSLAALPEEIDAFFLHDKYFLDVQVVRSDSAIRLYFDGVEDLFFTKNLSFFPKLEEFEYFDFTSGVFIEGDAFYNFKNNYHEANLSLEFGKVLLYGIGADDGRLRISYDSNSQALRGRNIFVTSTDGWSLSGNVFQSLKDYQYIFLVKGDFEPTRANSFMEKWWSRIFSEFSFVDNFPVADFYIEGQWGNPEFMYVYGFVDAKNILYNDAVFDSVNLLVDVNPSAISVFDVNIFAGKGTANAALSWVYNPEEGITSYYTRRIVASVDMNKKYLSALGGEDVEDLMELLNFDSNIKCKINLAAKNPVRDENSKEIVDFSFESRSFINVAGFPFESIAGKGAGRGSFYELENVRASFCGGHLTGDFSIRKNKDNRNFFVTEFKLENALRSKTEFFVREITNTQKEKIENGEKNEADGVLNLSASASGFVDDFSSVNAAGKFFLKDENLLHLDILGALSRALDALQIPIATISMQTFESPIALKNNILTLDAINIRGNNSSMIGKAQYDTANDNLSATLVFSLHAAHELMILRQLFSLALNPIMNAVQINISGTFEDPSFSFSLLPGNIFNDKDSILKSMGNRSL